MFKRRKICDFLPQSLERRLQEADRKSQALQDEKELMSLEMAARSVVSLSCCVGELCYFVLGWVFLFFSCSVCCDVWPFWELVSV